MSRNRTLVTLLGALPLLLVMACRAPGDGRPSGAFDLRAACASVAEASAVFTKAHVTGDVPTIDATFTQDATVLPPGGTAVVGMDAIHALSVEYLKAGVWEFHEQSTACYGNAALLVDQGDYVVVFGPDSTMERGKYLNVWTPEDGAWKIRANIWNTSAANP